MSSADGLFRQPKSFRRFIRPRPAFSRGQGRSANTGRAVRPDKSLSGWFRPDRAFAISNGPAPFILYPMWESIRELRDDPRRRNMPSVPPGRIPTAAVFSHPAADCRPCQRIPADIRRIRASSRHTCRAMHPLPGSAGKRCIGEVRILEKCGILIARKNLAAQGFFFMPSLREPLKLRGIPF